MKNTLQDIEQLQSRFRSCQKIFTALGDENRQRLLCIMLVNAAEAVLWTLRGKQIFQGRQFRTICRF